MILIDCPDNCNPPGSHIIGWQGYDIYEDCSCRDVAGPWGKVPGQFDTITSMFLVWWFSEKRYITVPTSKPSFKKIFFEAKLKWVCEVYTSGFHNGVHCSPEYPHEASWRCGYHYKSNITLNENDVEKLIKNSQPHEIKTVEMIANNVYIET